MLSFSRAATVFLIFSLATAAPLQGGLAIPQTPPTSARHHHPAELIVKALKKYGHQPQEHVRFAAKRGNVTAVPQPFDTRYLGRVEIAGQEVEMDFDTGSGDLWVNSKRTAGPGQKFYDPSLSCSSRLVNGSQWSIYYGDGSSARGVVYTDTVSVGGLVVPRQGIELASNTTANFQTSGSDGVLGLAFDQVNTVFPQQQKTFFSNAIPQLQSKLFTANLKRNAPGSYTFGYIDDSQHTGPITYTPVDNSKGFWNFSSEAWSVGTSSTQETVWGIADTGTTLLLAQDSMVFGYYARVPSSYYDKSTAGIMFDCTEQLPDFTLTINGYNAVVPGTYMNWAEYSNGKCYGSLQSNGGAGFAIWGDVFFKSQLVVFDNTPKIGFAAKA